MVYLAERSHLVTRTPTRPSALLGVALITLVFATAATAKPRPPSSPNDRGGIHGGGAPATKANHDSPNDRGGIHGGRK